MSVFGLESELLFEQMPFVCGDTESLVVVSVEED